MTNREKLNILLRLHEIEELKLTSVSLDETTSRKGYEHEYIQSKKTLELLNELLTEFENRVEEEEKEPLLNNNG